MKKLFLVLVVLSFLTGCTSPTTYYTKKIKTEQTVKEVNNHDYRRRTIIKQTTIIEVFDEIEPYGGKKVKYMENIVDKEKEISITID